MNKACENNTFLKEIAKFIPAERIYTNELRRLAWGTDAGFYRLIPQIVIRSENEQEVSRLLSIANRLSIPVTFRAAGTSLSGQAITDSVLIVAGKHWEKYTIAPDGNSIRLQPGIIGERVNELLKPFGRKFSPDPASVKSAMVGGIIINNASGMNCGTHANSDRMLLSARMVMADGTLLDTGDPDSCSQFSRNKPDFIQKINILRDQVRANQSLTERIRHKYSIKNVTGLNILPFILYDNPFDIITHLLVGSEGVLAFLSEATLQTEYDFPCKASAMLFFFYFSEACRAVVAMKKLKNEQGEWIVKGAELLDEKSLQSVELSQKSSERICHCGLDPQSQEKLDTDYQGMAGQARNDSLSRQPLTAVLTETKAVTPEELEANIDRIKTTLQDFQTTKPVYFTDKESEYQPYWTIRSGIFPSVGGTRQPGTTTLIEDVAFHIEDLPEATADLQQLMVKHHYDDACIYGHALEGNYHFIINQSFDTEAEVKRYEALMNDVAQLVVEKYGGSLKAEHGTGRNMAPFVRYEWGNEAFELMKEVKQLFDPKGILNPGVIFNDDPKCHLKYFKPLPLINKEVDKCIECGFCEVNCLTCGFTLSSRQRIVLQREIARLKATGEDRRLLRRLQKQFRYAGNQTCAGDGLCSTSCPMEINTGDLIHDLRQMELPAGSFGYAIGKLSARHFSLVKNGLRLGLSIVHIAHTVLGTKILSWKGRMLHRLLHLPLWTPAMPRSFRFKQHHSSLVTRHSSLKVIYFPSCINQTMGLEAHSPEKQALANTMISLLQKADYEVIFPKNMDNLCCGTIWESKGIPDIADRKSAELEAALYEASEQGKYPVLCDQSPCLYRMRHAIRKMKLYEPVEFITTFLADRLEFIPTDRPVAVHITCSMRKMGLAGQIVALAKRCSTRVFVPEETGCCGFAGDKGFTRPEVNAYALRKLRPQIEKAGIQYGYSNSRTCEIGLTTHSGIHYQSIVYLVDQCTEKIY
jgi:D-lactate dehydrogenase